MPSAVIIVMDGIRLVVRGFTYLKVHLSEGLATSKTTINANKASNAKSHRLVGRIGSEFRLVPVLIMNLRTNESLNKWTVGQLAINRYEQCTVS